MKDTTGDSIGDSLWNLWNQVGIPDRIIYDLAKAQEGVNTELQAAGRKLWIKLTDLRKDNISRTTRPKERSTCLSANGRS